ILAASASWQSQPLLVIAIGYLAYYLFDTFWRNKDQAHQYKPVTLFNSIISILLILAIPYLYNLTVFGVWSPWTKLQNIWTQYYGFGIQNISIFKLYEQFFDLNMGLFWYSPVIFIIGLATAVHLIIQKKAQTIFILSLFVATAFFYQTNPAWHYGTAGFGPTRHILFFLPLLIYFFIHQKYNHMKNAILITSIWMISQGYILYFNGFLCPNFLNVLQHSPFSNYILSNYPTLYNPTPEIFIDRTNHTDLDHPTTAVYKVNGICKKAYVLIQDKEKVMQDCGYIPQTYAGKFTSNMIAETDRVYSYTGFYI
ncbi:hypothetical protein COY90_02450, partial [Candidatus Roizmanbacteria bacterium CG_4_10_14_0_8_um_filter_39_9]